MTAQQIARSLHGQKAGKRWMCRCPTRLHAHGDRNKSLSVWESEDGWVRLKCFTGCSREEILGAMGLKVRDLALNEFKKNPEWEKERRDRDRLEILERRQCLAEWLWALDPESRYWRATAQNLFEEWYWLRCQLYPEEKAKREREFELQRIITEYGFEELWNCLPNRVQ